MNSKYCKSRRFQPDQRAGFHRGRALTTILTLFAVSLMSGVSHASIENGQKLYEANCTSCHTIGKGKLVGPDLAGVTSRRDTDWLHRQIKEPDQMLAEEDPIAVQLLKESNNVPMVPLGLNDGQVSDIIEYLESTEQQSTVAAGFPSQYVPTLSISVALLIVLTLVGLRAGNKKVDVR